MFAFYHHIISVCARKVRTALVEKSVPSEGKHVDLMKGEHLTPEFPSINPKGLVPGPVHNGDPFYESTIIPAFEGSAAVVLFWHILCA
jgi:glutathione S-transferase